MFQWSELQPVVNYANLLNCVSNFSFGPRTILDHQFIYVVKGRGTSCIQGKPYLAEEGNLFYYGPEIVHEFKADAQQPFTLIGIHFTLQSVAPTRGKVTPAAFFESRQPHPLEVTRPNLLALSGISGDQDSLILTDYLPVIPHQAKVILREIVNEYAKENAISPIYIRALLIQFLVLLAREQYLILPHSNNPTALALVQTVRKQLECHIEESYNRAWLHTWSGYHADYISKLFHNSLGLSPHQYFLYHKVRHAQQLLASTDFTISEISDQLHFVNIHYFSRCIKRYTGHSPREYRRLRKQI